MGSSSKLRSGNVVRHAENYTAKKHTLSQKTRVRRMRGDASKTRARSAPVNPRDDAASDDARGTTVALAAPSDATGTAREACAEVARKPKSRKPPRIPSEKPPPKATQRPTAIVRATKELPDYAGSFVDEVHRQADLIVIQRSLLNSKDEKIKQRNLERLLEMKYGKDSEAVEPAPQIVFDIARPNRIAKEEREER